MNYKVVTNLAVGVLALLPCTANAAKDQEPKRKNILVLMTDDQYYNSIHAMGNDQVITPNFDRLVEEGVIFNRHYATTSISMASRACLISGKYEYKTGCNFMRGPMTTDIFSQSYPVLMREGGYYTAFGGKFGFAVTDEDLKGKVSNRDEYLPIEAFDAWAGQGHSIEYETQLNKYLKQYADEYPHCTRALGEFGKEQIKAGVESGKPFCISLYFKAPHGRFTPDPAFEHIYRDTIFRRPVQYGEEYSEPLAMQGKLGRQRLEYFGYYHGDYQDTLYRLYTLIYGVDYVIGQLYEQLKECGVDEDTIIIFTSDNGYAFGENSLGGKVLPYDITSQVPLIIYDPANTENRGKFTDAVAGNIDITATILDYAGVKSSKDMDGVTLRKVVDNPESGSARESLALLNTWGNPHIVSLSVVTDEWKYIYWCYGEKIDPKEELFRVDDEFEINNLADKAEYADVLKKMRVLYDKQVKTIGKECVKTTGYPTLATIYDRHIPWSEKCDLFTEEQHKLYESYLKSIGYSGDKYDYEAVLEQCRVNDQMRLEKGVVNPHNKSKSKVKIKLMPVE